MKLLSFYVLFLSLTHLTCAQNPIARIKYEQAEDAFNKQDYCTTRAKGTAIKAKLIEFYK